jgi:DNA-binding XRE family transcriptional regulator
MNVRDIMFTATRTFMRDRKEPHVNTSLVEARTRANLTQVAVARVAGISERHYQAVEYGEHEPKVRRALRIARAVRSTVEELFGEGIDQPA